jgi:glyoxylase I family protein
MRTTIALVAGLLLGLALSAANPPASAQGTGLAGMRGVNHVGLSVDNLEEAVAFYTQKLGFPEAYRFKNDQGQTTIVFVQTGPGTFLEIAPSNANRPVGLTHFGVQVDNLDATIGALKERGLMATAPREVAPQWTIASVTGPGSRVEFTALGPQSALEKATASWRR